MAGMLGWFWHAHSHLSEGRARLAEALAAASEHGEDRARALGAAGALAGYQGDLAAARPLVDEAVAIWRAAGAEQDVAIALFDLGWACFFDGDNDSARRSMEQSLELQRQLGNPALVNRAQLGLLQMLVAEGELDDVPRLVDEALELSRSLGDTWAEHFALPLPRRPGADGGRVRDRRELVRAQPGRGRALGRRGRDLLRAPGRRDGVRGPRAGRARAADRRRRRRPAACARRPGTPSRSGRRWSSASPAWRARPSARRPTRRGRPVAGSTCARRSPRRWPISRRTRRSRGR